MSPQDRYQICGSVSGLIATASTKAEAFRLATKYIPDSRWDVNWDDMPIEIFDCFAHVGTPELWRYDTDAQSWQVVTIRKEKNQDKDNAHGRFYRMG